MFGFILVVIALQVLGGYDYQTLSILFVWQHKTAPSTYPQAMCLRPLTSQPPSARPPLFFFSCSSCSGWREEAWRMDKHRVFKRQQQKHWVEGYDNSSLLVTVLMQPSLWFPLFAMRVHCWLTFNFSSSWFFSAGVMDCFPGCTDARGYRALGTERGPPSSWTLWGSCCPRPEVCWGPSGLKLCHSCTSCVVYKFVEEASELLSRQHMKILNYISLLFDPGILWLLLKVNQTSVWLYPLITALW